MFHGMPVEIIPVDARHSGHVHALPASKTINVVKPQSDSTPKALPAAAVNARRLSNSSLDR